MNKLELVLHGRIPSKKNSRISFVRGGKMCNIPSKSYKIWHKEATDELSAYLLDKPVESTTKVTLAFYGPDKRKTDLTNKAESVMDLLVDNGFLIDDNWFVVSNINLKFIEVDKEDPRCLITIQH